MKVVKVVKRKKQKTAVAEESALAATQLSCSDAEPQTPSSAGLDRRPDTLDMMDSQDASKARTPPSPALLQQEGQQQQQTPSPTKQQRVPSPGKQDLPQEQQTPARRRQQDEQRPGEQIPSPGKQEDLPTPSPGKQQELQQQQDHPGKQAPKQQTPTLQVAARPAAAQTAQVDKQPQFPPQDAERAQQEPGAGAASADGDQPDKATKKRAAHARYMRFFRAVRSPGLNFSCFCS